MILSVVLMLLHNAVPHTHHEHQQAGEIMGCPEEEPARGILDLLREIFHFDLGDEHLEIYQHSRDMAPVMYWAAEFQEMPALPVVEATARQPVKKPYRYSLPPPLPLAAFSLRGPPTA